MKLNRNQLRKLILQEMSHQDNDKGVDPENMDDDPIRDMGFPDYQEYSKSAADSDVADASGAEDESFPTLDIQPLINSIVSDIRNPLGGPDYEEAAAQLVKNIDMANDDMYGIEDVALLLAKTVLTMKVEALA